MTMLTVNIICVPIIYNHSSYKIPPSVQKLKNKCTQMLVKMIQKPHKVYIDILAILCIYN